MDEAHQHRHQVVGGPQQPRGQEVVGGAACTVSLYSYTPVSRYTLLLLTRGGAGPGHVAQLEHEAAHQAAEDGEQVGRGEAEHQHRELPVTELGPSEYTSQRRSSSSTLFIDYWYHC